MFLKKVYKKNRLIFYGMVDFAFCQLFINYKTGLTATPFLHYGMYSGPYPIYEMINVREVEVNKTKLNLSLFHPRVVEQILEPINVFLEQEQSNALYYSHINRFLKFHFINDSNSFVSHITREEFVKWYTLHLSKIIRKPVKEFRIFETVYTVNKSSFLFKKKSLLLYGSD